MKNHWIEYGCEFFGTALLLFIGLSAVSLNFGAGSPVLQWIPSENVRRLLTGLIFAGGATAVVYSPLGLRSGGHINPAVTLSFYLLGRVKTPDAVLYAIAQCAGAVLGTFFVMLAWRPLAESTAYGATMPAPGITLTAAFGLETAMTFALVLVILSIANTIRIARFTPLAAGSLVAALVYFEAPYTGTSVNPARSLGSAFFSGNFDHYWLYVSAPLAGAILATALYALAVKFAHRVNLCAKLYHKPNYRCIFRCRYAQVPAQTPDASGNRTNYKCD